MGIGGARASLLDRRARLAAPATALYYGLPPRALQVIALRYREALADLFWVRAVLYFGLQGELKQPPRHIDLHMETVLALDPAFERAYSTAAALTQYRGAPRRASRSRAIAFLERGAQRFPQQWRFPLFIGAYYLDMPAANHAERARNHLLAADWVQRAALLGSGRGAPDWLPNLAATLLTEAGRREMALRYLEESLLNTQDEATRKQVRDKIMQLANQVEADRVSREAERFVRAWRESYPYVPADLFVLLGPRPYGKPFYLPALIDHAFGAATP